MSRLTDTELEQRLNDTKHPQPERLDKAIAEAIDKKLRAWRSS